MRFKELRGLVFSFLLAILDVVLVIESISSGEKDKISGINVSWSSGFIKLYNTFFVRVLNDCILIYHLTAIFLFPKIVTFKDLKSFTLKSKHHIILETDSNKEHIYVFNAHKLHQLLVEKMGSNHC